MLEGTEALNFQTIEQQISHCVISIGRCERCPNINS
jgi:hypothetical protein